VEKPVNAIYTRSYAHYPQDFCTESKKSNKTNVLWSSSKNQKMSRFVKKPVDKTGFKNK
jgi:hypothetical protein